MKKGFSIDMDGLIFNEDPVIHGASEFIAALQKKTGCMNRTYVVL